MTTAEAILADLLADETDWWAGELQTVTGYFVSEYRDLADRMERPDYELQVADRRLLYGAAMGLIYCDPPVLEARNTKAPFGESWVKHVEEFIKLMDTEK